MWQIEVFEVFECQCFAPAWVIQSGLVEQNQKLGSEDDTDMGWNTEFKDFFAISTYRPPRS